MRIGVTDQRRAELCRVDATCYEFAGELVVSGCTLGRLRQTIAWIAAYALALQAIVGSLGLIQTAASTAAFDPFAIICLNSDHGGAGDQTPGDGGRGGRPGCDCGCFLGSPAFVEPPDAAPLVFVAPDANEIIWPTADWRNKFAIRHPSQPPRGPPLPS